MNIEDYAVYMIQKHVLAIALAVIKSKPANIAYETYIDHIRNRIIQTDMESNLDITICEEDFNISDDCVHDDSQMISNDQSMVMNEQINESHDSVTILQNFNLNALDDLGEKEKDDANSLLDVMTELDNIEEHSVNENYCTQSTNFDESQKPMNVICDKNSELANNIEMFYETYIESNQEVRNNSKEVNINKYQNNITNSKSAIHATNINKEVGKIPYSQSNNFIKENKTVIENNNIDTQKTIFYTLQGFTSNTHVSQSQEDIVIANRNLLNRSNTVLNSNRCDQIVTQNITNSQTDQHNSRKEIQDGKEELECNVNADIIKENNKATDHDKIHFDANKINLIDKMTIFSDYQAPRKNKNPNDNYNIGSKRIKIDANDKIYTKSSSTRLEFEELSCIPKYQSNDTTKSYETDYDRNVEQDFAILSQNKDGNDRAQIYKETYNLTLGHTFQDRSNDLTPKISQDIQNYHTDRVNFETNTVDSIRTAQSLEFRFSPDESQSLLLSNENYGSKCINASLENIKLSDNNIYNTENAYTYINTDSNNSAKEKYQNRSEIKENTNFLDKLTNFDDPIINLSQTINNTNNYKTKELISGIHYQTNLKDFSNKHDEMKAISDFKESDRLKEKVLNNLPDDGTTADVSHPKKMTKECISNDNPLMDIPSENDFSDNEADTQLETVSFKTLEELNRIKSYLNKRERRFSEVSNSLDSGFRSSQPRSSYKSVSQHSEVWINESAHSLLSFITVSQLAGGTTEIADEISRLLKTDDTIYRLLQLNRSKHIIHYTIAKIIVILDKTNTDLTDDVFELKDIARTENLCHIFHILEVLLKRVKRTSENSQMSVQNSQDDERVLKRSSLTEIWKRKWNLTKSEVIEGSVKKKCVLTKCSEALNKMIVQAIDGYSLVSFAALQCFNLLQN
ncbi:jg19027 [Pararge aegeria aegeria]|uniref:Jg19027 protein n=1 Tax=Pararge aegeria aegeria TaxID=348720 RepID=A0A8S4R400_9NEOP|nr:jg19027 [Pararge aegeria aegeria]